MIVRLVHEFLTLSMADFDALAGYDDLRQMPESLLIASFGTMGAFAGVPVQRRFFSVSAFSSIP